MCHCICAALRAFCRLFCRAKSVEAPGHRILEGEELLSSKVTQTSDFKIITSEGLLQPRPAIVIWNHHDKFTWVVLSKFVWKMGSLSYQIVSRFLIKYSVLGTHCLLDRYKMNFFI